MQAFLEYVVKGLVQHPEEVTVTPVERKGTTVYELRLHPRMSGKIIGRQGHDHQRHPFAAAGGQRQERPALHAWRLSKNGRQLTPSHRSRRVASAASSQASTGNENRRAHSCSRRCSPGPLDESIIKRAREAGLLDLRIHNLRDWTHDRHKTVDDRPFGGGPGMLLKPEPIFEAVENLAR